MKPAFLAAAVGAALWPAAPVTANPFGAAAMTDVELADLRGAIELPGGVVARIGIAIETRVDGQLALRTQFSTEAPGVQLFAGGPAGAPPTIVAMGGAAPDVRIERNNIGTTVTLIPAAPPIGVQIGRAADITPAQPPLAIVPNGAGVATALGTVTLTQTAAGFVGELNGTDLAVRQLIGQATGTIVANAADNRVIDTVTIVNVDLQGVVLPGGLGGALTTLFGGIR